MNERLEQSSRPKDARCFGAEICEMEDHIQSLCIQMKADLNDMYEKMETFVSREDFHDMNQNFVFDINGCQKQYINCKWGILKRQAHTLATGTLV